MRASIIRIGFWGMLYYSCNKGPPPKKKKKKKNIYIYIEYGQLSRPLQYLLSARLAVLLQSRKGLKNWNSLNIGLLGVLHSTLIILEVP